MTYAGFVVLLSFAVMFSNHEKRLWGSGKTPFAFVVYPFLGLLFIAVFIAPSMGFRTLHVETILVIGLFFALFAVASVSLARIAGERARAPSRLEALGARPSSAGDEHTVTNLEFLVLGGVFLLVFGASIASRGIGVVEKGMLGVGGFESHLIGLGVAYFVVAASQVGGPRVVRTAFALLVLWILAINQVKYLIFVPFAGALLYRWVSGQLTTWKVVLLAVGVPLMLGVAVYAYFGVSAAVSGVALTSALVTKLTWHLIGYVVAGIIGLDQLLLEMQTVAFGGRGLEYAFAPLVNIARFVVGAGEYVNTVNPLYLIIHSSDLIDSNVYTVFGSLLYRAGWVGAVSITLTYALVSYWIWTRWRMRESALACAAGTWWMAPLLFTWFDPYFTSFSVLEIMVILSLRGSVRIPPLLRRAPRAAAETSSAPA
ncbi:MAG TPA: DUF6337 family protein [Gemmatimonadaceae bacterium]|nr:DUF6337 family protein [Gemmatimonadaceae bacterium]